MSTPTTSTWIETLQSDYTFNDPDVVNAFIHAKPMIYPLLREAVEPIRQAFGDENIVAMRGEVIREDGELLLYITVQLSQESDVHKLDAALQDFDNGWWINNCHRANGVLVFDYEWIGIL